MLPHPVRWGFLFATNEYLSHISTTMIRLKFGETNDIVVTLNEKRTRGEGYYLFVFTNYTTKDVVNKIYAFTDDLSNYQDRYNRFQIDTSTVFSGKRTGFWKYNIYEQEGNSNTNTTGLTEVESGIMKLLPASDFAFDTYNETTTFKSYSGE